MSKSDTTLTTFAAFALAVITSCSSNNPKNLAEPTNTSVDSSAEVVPGNDFQAYAYTSLTAQAHLTKIGKATLQAYFSKC